MIVVSMMLHSAVTLGVSELCSIKIVNDGTGTLTRGNYEWEIRGRKKQVIRTGRVENWPRNARSAPQLLAKVLVAAYPSLSEPEDPQLFD